MTKLYKIFTQWGKTKFKNSYIKDIHREIIEANGDIALMVVNFAIIWDAFEPDSSNNHIELILISILSKPSLTSRIVEYDNDKFKTLLSRILTITYDIRQESNFRLQRLCIQWINQLGELDNSDTKTMLKSVTQGMGPEWLPKMIISNWYSNLIDKTVALSYEFNDPEFIEYVKSILMLISTLETNPCPCYNIKLCQDFNLFLKLVMTSDNSFYKHLQLKNYTSDFLNKPSYYDITMEEATNFFNSLDTNELINLTGFEQTRDCMINYLTFKVMGDNFNNQWDEHIIDRFDNLPPFKFNLPREENFEFKYYIYNHLMKVLDRINISLDKSNNLNITGKSKYFKKVKQVKLGEVIVDKFDNHFRYFLAINIVKPNKFSPINRIKKFGINSVKLVKVQTMNNTNNTTIKFNDDLQMTHIISIPDSRPIRMHDFNPVKTDEFSVPKNIVLQHVPDGLLQPPTKKRKEDEPIKLLSEFEAYGTESVNDDKYDEMIFKILSTKESIINTPPHTLFPFLNNLLTTIALNNERSLIVVPNEHYLNLPIEVLASNTSKSGMQIYNDLREEICKLGNDLQLEYDNEIDLISKLEKLWDNYLVSGKLENYPFADYRSMEAVIYSYSKIVEKFNDLKNLRPILKLPSAQINQYMKYSFFRTVILTEDEIITSNLDFENLILVDSHLMVDLVGKIGKRRVIKFGEFANFDFSLNQAMVNAELSKFYNPTLEIISVTLNDEFKHSIQLIPIKQVPGQVNIPEAEYVVELYRYMIKKYDVGIIGLNEFQIELLKEMTSNMETTNIETTTSFGHDYIIVSTFGYTSVNDIYDSIKRANKRIFFVGDVDLDIHKLQIKTQGKIIRIDDIQGLK